MERMIKTGHVRKIVSIGLPTLALALLVLGAVVSQAEAQSPLDEEGQQATNIDPGPGTEYIGPDLWALLQRQARGETNLPSARVGYVSRIPAVGR